VNFVEYLYYMRLYGLCGLSELSFLMAYGLCAVISGAELGAVICGAELPATSDPRQKRTQDLGAMIHGVET